MPDKKQENRKMNVSRVIVVVGLMLAVRPSHVAAADLFKADNNQPLNLAASWVNGIAPANTNRMVWSNNVVTAENCTNTYGATLNALGLRIVDPPADVSLASSGGFGVNLYGGGVDMSVASRDLFFTTVPYTATFAQSASATWKIAAGRTLSIASRCYLAGDATGNFVVTWTGGGTIRMSASDLYFVLPRSSLTTATLVISNITVISDAQLSLGYLTSSSTTGTVLQTSGSNYMQYTASSAGLALGVGSGTAPLSHNTLAVYDLSGGLLSVTTNMYLGPVAAGCTNVASRFTVRGSGTALIGSDIWMGGYKATNGTATLTLKTGGTLSVQSVRVDSTVVNGMTKMEFDGGTLRPTVSTTSFLAGLTQATLSTNGAVIDTNGRDIAIRQTLENAAGQMGKMVKLGAGTLTLTNVNTFSGATIVSNGTLQLSANASLVSTNWTVSSGATFKFDGAVTLSGKDVVIDAGGSLTPGLLDVTGSLTLGGKLTVVNPGDRQKVARCTGTLSADFDTLSLPRGYYLRQVGGKELWVIRSMGTCIRVL